MNVQLIFWPKGGNVDRVAQKLEKLLGLQGEAVESLDYTRVNDADLLIIGGSTVGADHWKNELYKDPWSLFVAELKEKGYNLKGKKVALFGLGNQVLYPSHFVDSLKSMADVLTAAGAELVGFCENKGYEFYASEALVDGQFIGLPIDEDTQADMTDQRLAAWVKSLGL